MEINKSQAVKELERLERPDHCDVCGAVNTPLTDFYLMLCPKCQKNLTSKQWNQEYKKYYLKIKELKEIIREDNSYQYWKKSLEGVC